MKTNMVSWFEIPVLDMDRAKLFYETVFNVKITVQEFGEELMGWFEHSKDENTPGIGGSLNKHKEYVPSSKGTLVYFSSQTGDITDELSRIETAGGKIVKPKTLIAEEIGYMALFLDSEGNRVALYNK